MAWDLNVAGSRPIGRTGLDVTAKGWRTVAGIPDQRGREFQKRELLGPAILSDDVCGPNSLALRRDLHQPMFLHHIKEHGVLLGDTRDAVGEQVSAQLVAGRLADQPERILGEPTV